LDRLGERTAMVSIIRGLLVALGLLAALWGASNFRSFWYRSSDDRLATRILSGEVFKDANLLRTVEENRDRFRCDVAALHALAIMHLRNLEIAIAANIRDNISAAQITMHDAIVASLSCAPADPFLWLVLAWGDSQSKPRDADALTFLRLSYQLGPNEGWIAIKRNFVSLSMFDQLPADIADRVLIEFRQIVIAGRYEEAANIFVGPGWAQREFLLQKLSEIDRFHRDSFAKVLTNRGYNVSALGPNPFFDRIRR
jgi:hypothetical protein